VDLAEKHAEGLLRACYLFAENLSDCVFTAVLEQGGDLERVKNESHKNEINYQLMVCEIAHCNIYVVAVGLRSRDLLIDSYYQCVTKTFQEKVEAHINQSYQKVYSQFTHLPGAGEIWKSVIANYEDPLKPYYTSRNDPSDPTKTFVGTLVERLNRRLFAETYHDVVTTTIFDAGPIVFRRLLECVNEKPPTSHM
jgi:hypothetical protein